MPGEGEMQPGRITSAGRLMVPPRTVAMTAHDRPSLGGPSLGELQFRRSLAAIRAAAERRACLSYGDVAAASNLTWQAARRRMDPHLFGLCRWATERGWPLLTAIVVDRRNLAHGAMKGTPLIGFARAAERCGRVVSPDAIAFLADEQQRVFDWAERERGHELHD